MIASFKKPFQWCNRKIYNVRDLTELLIRISAKILDVYDTEDYEMYIDLDVIDQALQETEDNVKIYLDDRLYNYWYNKGVDINKDYSHIQLRIKHDED